MATLTATGQDKVQKGFEPLVPGFIHVPFNDLNAVEQAITPATAAVMLELVQGEGGVQVADQTFVKSLRDLCRQRDILFILDEVQRAWDERAPCSPMSNSESNPIL